MFAEDNKIEEEFSKSWSIRFAVRSCTVAEPARHTKMQSDKVTSTVCMSIGRIDSLNICRKGEEVQVEFGFHVMFDAEGAYRLFSGLGEEDASIVGQRGFKHGYIMSYSKR